MPEIDAEDPVPEMVATLTLVLCLEGGRIGDESMEGAGALIRPGKRPAPKRRGG